MALYVGFDLIVTVCLIYTVAAAPSTATVYIIYS